MPTIAAANGPVYTRRRRLGVVAAFVGSSLIAVMAPAYAQPADPGDSPAEVTLETYESTVDRGADLAPNEVSISNNGDAAICLSGLSVDHEDLYVSDLSEAKVEPGDTAWKVATINGVLGEPDTYEITASLTYAFAEEDGGCSDSDGGESANSDVWSVTVEEEDPSPTPTPTPPETPTESPTETPTDPPPPEPTETETERPTPTPTETSPEDPPDTPTDGAGEDDGDSGDSSDGDGDGDGGGDGGSDTTSPESSNPGSDDPGPDASDPPTSDATVPTLPRDEAELPDVSPEEDDLAELPTVSPESEEDELDQSEAAADHSGPASMAPAVLLAAFLLALLLATPLAPTRRVRLGILGYQGKRRKGRF